MKLNFKTFAGALTTLAISTSAFAQGQRNLLADIENYRRATTSLQQNLTDDQKAQRLEDIYRSMSQLNLNQYALTDLRTNAPLAVEKLFRGRLDLRNQLMVWEARKGAQGGYQVNERLINSIRKIFRVFRTAEDMIGETGIQHGKLQNNQQAETAFQASNQGNLVIYPKYRTEPLEIKDGDVIVMRGNRHNSAAIARITTEDSQFSHALIVHIANDGKKYAVEALIEEGIVIHDLDKILNEGVGRMILLRQADQHLARQAALIAYNRGREAEAKSGEPYDFSMSIFKTNSNGRVEVNYDSFFCSKVISFAYDIASNGHFVPGRYLSKLPQNKNGPFLAGIGVTAAETIAPGDLEVDTRFDIVAEWRDFRITQGLRLREVVLDKLFDMMENQGYQFQANAEINIISRTAKNLSRVPLFAGLITMLVGKIPSYMNQDVIATMMMLQFTADPMYQDLIQVDNEYSRTTGLTMSPLALSAILERNIQAGKYSLTYLVR